MIKLYNTANRKIENFKPISDVVKIYTCGPTVYSEAHIGNLTAYIYWDLLVRTLKLNDFKVKRVLNLTDVGHLVSDADEGEDKLEKGARKDGKTVWEVAEKYIEKFKDDYRSLNLTEPEIWARATDFIEEDKNAVDKMTAGGFTYETADGIYYDTAKFPQYADFARLDLEGLRAGARVSFSDEKRNASDFAVWKFIQPGEKHEMRWDYLGRPGYPGWHLECSTIIDKELGEPIDIHTGGIDHIPVHHTNEIAQTFAISGLELAKYWLHCDFIMIEGEKISKSLGNVYSLDDLSARGFSAIDFKMWVLSGHYQGARNFTFESLEAAKHRRLNWRNRIASLYQSTMPTSPIHDVFNKILSAVNDNLNSSEAFAIIDTHELAMEDWEKVDELFGLNLITNTPDVSEETYALISEREKARAEKNYARSDEIRNKLKAQGIAIEDTPNGPVWQYI
ncbi:cysteine--tRNA ligase [Candidatus Saccharibacteria bacterium]|nr:cysteine--tRNA ligase [Candidatus Saccharibacteria bacterium]